jgi:hypothetical protein
MSSVIAIPFVLNLSKGSFVPSLSRDYPAASFFDFSTASSMPPTM